VNTSTSSKTSVVPVCFSHEVGSLYRWVLPQISAEALEQVLSMWVKATSLASPTDPLAVDGKTVRGARTAERDAPHLLSCFTHHSQEVWAQLAVGEQTNEIPAARKLLPTLPISGRVCTFDALHSHRQLWRLLRSKHAYPLCVIKGNEPTLQADLATYFTDPHAQFLQAETRDRQRGRVERRAIQVSSEMGPYLQACWPGVTHVAQLTRTRTAKDKTTVEVVYLIAILPSGSDGPQSLLALSRGHWGIENSLHSVRDVTFAEDRSRIRTGHAPQLLAACRNLAMTLIHRSGSSHIAASRRSFSYHPRRAFDLLFARASPQQ
jgi:predicted transposase YbfD/YdcC